MKVSLRAVIVLAAVVFASAANAQMADKRSFFHPLGFWGNDGFVAQREVYPRGASTVLVIEPSPYTDPCCGGGLMHERNW
jgi:hypothetical protein